MEETGRLWLYVWDYQRQRYVHTVYAYKEFGIGECGRHQCEVIERDITEERARELMGQMPGAAPVCPECHGTRRVETEEFGRIICPVCNTKAVPH